MLWSSRVSDLRIWEDFLDAVDWSNRDTWTLEASQPISRCFLQEPDGEMINTSSLPVMILIKGVWTWFRSVKGSCRVRYRRKKKTRSVTSPRLRFLTFLIMFLTISESFSRIFKVLNCERSFRIKTRIPTLKSEHKWTLWWFQASQSKGQICFSFKNKFPRKFWDKSRTKVWSIWTTEQEILF